MRGGAMITRKTMLLWFVPLCVVGQERGVPEEEVFVPENDHDHIDWEEVEGYIRAFSWGGLMVLIALLAVLVLVAISCRTRRRRRNHLT